MTLSGDHILVLAHDAGGAELLASLLKADGAEFAWTAMTLAGAPAEAIFRRAGLPILALADAAACEAHLRTISCNAALYNPGWGIFPQRLAERALLGRTPCAAVLDSWNDYRERFGHPAQDWERGLPDAIALCDPRALALARELRLPRLARLRNRHLEALLERIAARRQHFSSMRGGDLLFLSQTTADHGMSADGKGRFAYAGAHEGRVLADLLAHGPKFLQRFGTERLRIRLHPSETICRHLDMLVQSGLPFTIEQAGQADLVDSILSARAVIGINTMALYTAWLCGRPTASLLPDAALGRVLPLPPELLFPDAAALLRHSPAAMPPPRPETFADAGLTDLLNLLLHGA
jgi:hypothetical protein